MEGERERDSLSQHERQPSKLEQVPHDEQERVKHLFVLGRAPFEHNHEQRDETQQGDQEVERVVITRPELLLEKERMVKPKKPNLVGTGR